MIGFLLWIGFLSALAAFVGVCLLVAALALRPVWRMIRGQSERAAYRRRYQAANRSIIAVRAERENREYLAGNPRGIYGSYTPVDLDV
ncbi:hypothetical protein [Rhodococcus phage RGL3]|uniref:Uncharacterized protein n=1 Tax=Rhodococcus phage RGL3 TaxID=2922221 RepID=G9FHQ6_9CAUD|nr:hypothetical protein RoPhRGL3_gp64 [Rhodococcus phage RGL3]AEV52144.1 hypothetical protein [Rhodococcus phage RGL3]